jgi:hypothetical protein
MSRFEFNDCSPEEKTEVANSWTSPQGLVQNDSNAHKVAAYIISRHGAWSAENLTTAVNALRGELEWNYADLRSTKAKLQDLGIRQEPHASQDQQEADFDKKKRLAKDFIENGPLAQRRRYEQEQKWWNAEHQTLYFKNGRVDHAGSEAARNEAIAAHRAADATAKK